MNVAIEPTWKRHVAEEFEKPYFKTLAEFVRSEYECRVVYPPPKAIFRAFELCPFDRVSVVILGQDPYHGRGQANGLAFAVNEGMAIPPSLQNIYKEIEADFGEPMKHRDGDLTRWAVQGVLLLNATLSVRAHNASISSSCFGETTPKPKAHISIEKGTWCSNPPILRHFQQTTGSLGTAILAVQIPTCASTDESQLNGNSGFMNRALHGIVTTYKDYRQLIYHMTYSYRVEQALRAATILHRDQTRKGTR